MALTADEMLDMCSAIFALMPDDELAAFIERWEEKPADWDPSWDEDD